jgi:hypothetical protein
MTPRTPSRYVYNLFSIKRTEEEKESTRTNKNAHCCVFPCRTVAGALSPAATFSVPRLRRVVSAPGRGLFSVPTHLLFVSGLFTLSVADDTPSKAVAALSLEDAAPAPAPILLPEVPVDAVRSGQFGVCSAQNKTNVRWKYERHCRARNRPMRTWSWASEIARPLRVCQQARCRPRRCERVREARCDSRTFEMR